MPRRHRRNRAAAPPLKLSQHIPEQHTRHSGETYNYRRVRPENAVKTYICPGCNLTIQPGTPHIVAWRADSIFGDDHALSERRHWHSRCWQIP